MKFYQSGLSFFRKTALDEPLYKLSAGRSMVEMLGVLAIIGVLSVGAISGYSKAMSKYKLNKQTEQLNTVINAIARHVESFYNLTVTTNITPYLIKLGEIPTEMIKESTTSTIYDVFGTSIQIFHQPQNTTSNTIPNVTSMFYSIPLNTISQNSLDICLSVLNIAKEHQEDLYYIYLSSGYGSDDSRMSNWYGNNYCTSGLTCLKDMDIENMTETCLEHQGNKKGGAIVLLWRH